ncbi:MAG: TrbG/VirB9 family P-type conjugative transfer protein [Aeromonas sp.]
MNYKNNLILTLVFFAGAANSAAVGIGSRFDGRIQHVTYNPDNVTSVKVKKGTVSLVQFADDEKIEGIGLGDPAAWNVSVKRNHIFFRPTVEDNPNTNVAVLTNKNNYSLTLALTKGEPTYILKFDYPKPIKPMRYTAKKTIPCNNGGVFNGNYQIQGSVAISPYQIWDDGQFVCMRWVGAKDLPIVYRVNGQGNEVLANTHMTNNTMVIHELSDTYALRLGDQVLNVKTKTTGLSYYNLKGTSNGKTREEITK